MVMVTGKEIDEYNDQEKELSKFLVNNEVYGFVSTEWPDGHWVLDELFPAVRKAHKEQSKYIILVWEAYEKSYFTCGCKTLQDVSDAIKNYCDADMMKVELAITYQRARIASDIEFDEDKYDEDDNLIMPSWAA